MTGMDALNISHTIVTYGDEGGDPGPDDRYYSPAEYHELSKAAKSTLYEKHEKRDRGGDDDKSSRCKPARKTEHQELTRVIKALTQQLGKQRPPEEQDSGSSSEEELTMKEAILATATTQP